MSDFGTELSRLMADRGVGVRPLARAVFAHPSHIGNLRTGKSRLSPELADLIDEYLEAGGRLAALAAATRRSARLAGH
jgi:plasmid maintenance system antidote protein VapI